jgi:hypothetical protein
MIHIVTCAYKAWEWAERHVEAIRNQEGEFIHHVGIDGCERTLEAYNGLQHDKMKLYYTHENIGKSMLQNTVIDFLPDNANVLTFDADDFIAEGTVKRLTKLSNRMPLLSKLAYSNNGKKMDGYANGVLFFKKSFYIQMGGFNTLLKVSEDTDFIKRVKARHGILPHRVIGIPSFYRTVHDASLSHSDNKDFRKTQRMYSDEQLRLRKYQIDFVTSNKIREV